MGTRMNQRTSGWLRVGAGLCVNIFLGTIYSWSVFRNPIEDLFSLAPTESGFPYMVFLAVFAFSMPLGGMLIEKLGPKTAIRLGGALLSVGWIASSYAGRIWQITLAYGVMGGLGVGIAYGVPLAVASKWFREKKGLAMGIVLVGFGLSPFVTAPLAERLITDLGVLHAFRVMGVVFAAIVGTFSFALRYPDEPTDVAADAEWSRVDEVALNPAAMVRTQRFYTLWILFAIGTLTGLMVIGITSPAAQEIAGVSSPAAALVVSGMAVFNGIGRPLFGALIDRAGARPTVIGAFVLIAAASFVMLLVPVGNVPLFLLAFAMFWLLLGGWLAIAPAATSAFFGSKYYTLNYGIMYTAYGVGAILGTVVSGRVRTAFGSYRMAFLPTLILSAVGIAVAFVFLAPARQKEEVSVR